MGIEVDTSTIRETTRNQRRSTASRNNAIVSTSLRRSERRHQAASLPPDVAAEHASDNRSSQNRSVGHEAEDSPPAGTAEQRSNTSQLISSHRRQDFGTHSTSSRRRARTVRTEARARSGGTRTTSTANSAYATDDQANKKWLDAISKSDVSLYRVRTFMSESRTKEDKFGRKCSFWCIKNGYIASSSRIMTGLPKRLRHDAEGARNYIRNTDTSTLIDMCRDSPLFTSNEASQYCYTYKYFISMKPGDIVAMHIKGGNSKNDPPQEFAFGVVDDDSLILMSKSELLSEHGFPWSFDCQDKVHFDSGIMLRKVKWMRRGIMHEVRGKNQANWLAEAQPKWMAKVEGDNDRHFNEAIRKMTSNQFIRTTRTKDLHLGDE